MPSLAPRKSISEIRFRANLSIYPMLDNVAMELMSDELDDWVRRPLSVELQNRKQHFRFSIESSRLFYETDEAVQTDTGRGDRLIKQALGILGGQRPSRAGVREWYAVDIDGLKEPSLLNRLLNFLSPAEKLNNIFGASLDDVAYTFEFKSTSLPEYGRMVLGVMTKDEWTDHTPYESKSNAITHISSKAIEDVTAALPSDFLFVDIDRWMMPAAQQADAPPSIEPFLDFLTAVRERNLNTVRELIKLMKAKP